MLILKKYIAKNFSCTIILIFFVLASSGVAFSEASSELSINLIHPAPRVKLRWGDPLRVEAEITTRDKTPIFRHVMYVTALIEYPDNKTRDVMRLNNTGTLGDLWANDSIWSNIFTRATLPGVYKISVKVWYGGKVFWSKEKRAFIYQDPRKPLPWGWIVGVTASIIFLISTFFMIRKYLPGWRKKMEEMKKKKKLEELQKIKIPTDDRVASLSAELNRYRQELATLKEKIIGEQRNLIFNSLEKMLIQLPTVSKYVEKGEDIHARDVLWLLAPLDKVIKDLGFQSIGKIDEIVPYNPDIHEPMSDTEEKILFGAPVIIKFIGYRDEQQVFRKARVEPVEPTENLIKD